MVRNPISQHNPLLGIAFCIEMDSPPVHHTALTPINRARSTIKVIDPVSQLIGQGHLDICNLPGFGIYPAILVIAGHCREKDGTADRAVHRHETPHISTELRCIEIRRITFICTNRDNQQIGIHGRHLVH